MRLLQWKLIAFTKAADNYITLATVSTASTSGPDTLPPLTTLFLNTFDL
jgi:hypothetical protein